MATKLNEYGYHMYLSQSTYFNIIRVDSKDTLPETSACCNLCLELTPFLLDWKPAYNYNKLKNKQNILINKKRNFDYILAIRYNIFDKDIQL
jgi:hypothetical protein